MKKSSHNETAFFTSIKIGLWKDFYSSFELKINNDVNWEDVYQFAEEQSVTGLLASGIDWIKNNVPDVTIPKEIALQIVGSTMQIEQRNKAMNSFLASIIENLRTANIYALLVKGQGVAQCYERPLWRSCGDIDLLLNQDNYCRAKQLLTPMAIAIEPENEVVKHFGLTIDSWTVELHGSLRSGALRKMDRLIDDVQIDVFNYGNVRSWMNGKTQIFIPSADNDVVFVFTHILKHFFHGGIGLRQVCDWCRLLWTYKDSINQKLLAEKIKKAGLMSEWKSFASFAVKYLGMPAEAMPFYSHKTYWARKAKRIKDIIIKSGNFGQNLNNYKEQGHPLAIKKLKSFNRYFRDFISQFMVFPKDAVSVWCWVLKVGASTMLERT